MHITTAFTIFCTSLTSLSNPLSTVKLFNFRALATPDKDHRNQQVPLFLHIASHTTPPQTLTAAETYSSHHRTAQTTVPPPGWTCCSPTVLVSDHVSTPDTHVYGYPDTVHSNPDSAAGRSLSSGLIVNLALYQVAHLEAKGEEDLPSQLWPTTFLRRRRSCCPRKERTLSVAPDLIMECTTIRALKTTYTPTTYPAEQSYVSVKCGGSVLAQRRWTHNRIGLP